MKVLKCALAVSLAFATTGAVFASTGGSGIAGTRHDFATRTNFLGSQVLRPGTANTVGLCSYCHTPHSALATSLLWNKEMSANTFTWSDAVDGATTGGTSYSSMSPSYKGPTVKCLACHDGSVAVGDVAMYKGSVSPSLNTFKVGDQPTDYAGKTYAASGTDSRPQYKIGTGGSMNGNHPVGMPYPELGGATYNGKAMGANVVVSEFQPLATAHQVTATSTGGGLAASTLAPVAAGGGSAASLIKLYTDTAGAGVIRAGTAAGVTGMECSTCHDPHNKQTVDDWMLRGTAQGSTQASGYICLQCHIK